jgi:hypothetical protein
MQIFKSDQWARDIIIPHHTYFFLYSNCAQGFGGEA